MELWRMVEQRNSGTEKKTGISTNGESPNSEKLQKLVGFEDRERDMLGENVSIGSLRPGENETKYVIYGSHLFELYTAYLPKSQG